MKRIKEIKIKVYIPLDQYFWANDLIFIFPKELYFWDTETDSFLFFKNIEELKKSFQWDDEFDWMFSEMEDDIADQLRDHFPDIKQILVAQH